MKKRFLFLAFSFFAVTNSNEIDHAWQHSPYFNTNFLSKYDLVEQTLIKQGGFEPVTFTSSDGLNLCGLLLQKPQAEGTIIFCAGFCPGRKEGQAPIYAMLPAQYNILFFDARGHAGSEGFFWRTMNQYGKHEYKDVLGAISFVEKNIGGPIVLYGVCAGAFHATHALIELEKQNKREQSGIEGLIFDSGFGSALQITQSDALNYHIREKFLPRQLGWYANKNKIKKTLLYKTSAYFLTRFAKVATKLLWIRGVKNIEAETNLFDKIHQIGCPIFFIHCKNDNYAPFESIVQLSENVSLKKCWWLEDSSHALHAIKHKVKYREQFLEFLDSVLKV